MPPELIFVGVALILGAWIVMDQRSLSEKAGFLIILFIIYVCYQWLSGHSFSEIFGQIIHLFYNPPPPASE